MWGDFPGLVEAKLDVHTDSIVPGVARHLLHFAEPGALPRHSGLAGPKESRSSPAVRTDLCGLVSMLACLMCVV